MAMKYPSALPQSTSMGGYYNQVNKVSQKLNQTGRSIPAAGLKKRPATAYQPNAVQNAIAFLKGGRK